MADPERERAFMSLWLADKLAPGDRVVADISAFTGPRLGWDLLAAPIWMVGMIAAWHDWFYGPLIGPAEQGVLNVLGLAAACWQLVSLRVRKNVYLAITERRVVAVQMRGRTHPVLVLFSAPIGALRLTTRDGLLLRTITCAALDRSALSVGGKDRARVRLTTRGRRGRFDEMLNAIRAQGGAVDLPTPPAVPALDGGR